MLPVKIGHDRTNFEEKKFQADKYKPHLNQLIYKISLKLFKTYFKPLSDSLTTTSR